MGSTPTLAIFHKCDPTITLLLRVAPTWIVLRVKLSKFVGCIVQINEHRVMPFRTSIAMAEFSILIFTLMGIATNYVGLYNIFIKSLLQERLELSTFAFLCRY